MSKKLSLPKVDYFDFDLASIVSVLKEYTLIWHLQRVFKKKIIKRKNLLLLHQLGGQTYRSMVSNYHYQDDSYEITVVKNRLIQDREGPFMVAEGQLSDTDTMLEQSEINEKLSKIPILPTKFLINEIKNVDFFIKFREKHGEASLQDFRDAILQIPQIEFYQSINFEELKSKENFLF